MALSRKYYEMIAESIKATLDDLIPGGDHYMYANIHSFQLAHRFADQLQKDNPNFNRERFIKACGVSD